MERCRRSTNEAAFVCGYYISYLLNFCYNNVRKNYKTFNLELLSCKLHVASLNNVKNIVDRRRLLAYILFICSRQFENCNPVSFS